MNLNPLSNILREKFKDIVAEFDFKKLGYDIIASETKELKDALPASMDAAMAVVKFAQNCDIV
jgi:hypothetical protein